MDAVFLRSALPSGGDGVGIVDLVANFVLAAVTLAGATHGLTVQVRAGTAQDIDGCLIDARP